MYVQAPASNLRPPNGTVMSLSLGKPFFSSSQPLQDEIDKNDKDNNTGPENPLVLLGPPLNHANRVSGDAQRIRGRVKLPLRPLEHVPLVAQIPQHGPAPLQVFIQRRIRV